MKDASDVARAVLKHNERVTQYAEDNGSHFQDLMTGAMVKLQQEMKEAQAAAARRANTKPQMGPNVANPTQVSLIYSINQITYRTYSIRLRIRRIYFKFLSLQII